MAESTQAVKPQAAPQQTAKPVAKPQAVKPSVRFADSYSFAWGSPKYSKDGSKLSLESILGQINLTEKSVGAPLPAGFDNSDIEDLLANEWADKKFIVRRAKKFSDHGRNATALRESVAMTGAEIVNEIGIEGAHSTSSERS